jgi:hypothetical protein
MATRFLYLRDLFEIKCKKCGSINVEIYSEECHECGNLITAECNKCKSKYDYHDFKQVNVEYDKQGKEIIQVIQNENTN